MWRLVLAICFAFSVAASPAGAVQVAVNPAFVSTPDAGPKKLVLLPPQIFVFELSAGGVPTRKSDWEKLSRANFSAAAERIARERGAFEVVPAPALATPLDDVVEAHMGLYERVASSVFVYGRGDSGAWAHKRNEFDYTLGPGLAFLRESTGADTALILLGADYISSGGRKLAFLAGLALGVVMPLGQTFVAAGAIDLKTGDVQWMGFDSSASLDSREPVEVDGLLRGFYATWPGSR